MGGAMVRRRRAARAAAVLVVALGPFAASAIGCQQIIGIPDRSTRENVTCNDGACACTAGFGDCDGTLANGCETAIATDQNNCGGCGAICANGTCAAGACGCVGGFDDCDADPKNGCETELASSPTSCGACGHDCLGGPCDASLCGPAKLGDAPSPGSIVVAGGYLYYTDFDISAGSYVKRIPVAGGAAETVVTVPPASPLRDLAVTGTYLAVFSDHTLYRVDLATKAKQAIYTYAAGNIMNVVASDTTIFVVIGSSTTFSPEEIVSIDATSGVSASVTTDVSSNDAGLSLAKGVPYWIDAAGTISTEVGGAPAVMPMSPTDLFGLSADDDYLFAVVWPPSSNDFGLKRIHLADGAVVETVMPANYKTLAPAGPDAFWFDGDNALVAWTEAGSRDLAQNVVTFDSAGIAVDDVAVYGGGPLGIFRVAR